MLNQMRFGRALDNRRLKASGYVYRYTTREAVLKLREHLRLRSLLRSSREPYRYEREVEEFLRWSPSVRHRTGDPARALSPRQVTQLTKLLSAATGEGAQGNAPPAASRPPEQAAPGRRPAPVEEYDSLGEEEVVGLLGSLERADLEALRRHEAGQRARTRVLVVIDGLLAAGARRAPPRPPG
jgi:UDP-glucose 4-epimerase